MKDKISANTKLLGILGHPVSHSLSPTLHNQVLEWLSLDYVYTAFDVAPKSLANAVKGLTALGVAGYNVTIPHKESIIPLLDHISPSAALISAVNTVVVQDGETFGYNTDVTGFARSLTDAGFAAKDAVVTVLGAGGAAKAVITALVELGVKEIGIANRNESKAKTLAAGYEKNTPIPIKGISSSTLSMEIKKSNLLVNATSVGMKGDQENQSPVDKDDLHRNLWVCDLVYRPLETQLLQSAAKAGCKTIDGLGMLVHQGADAFRLWTEIEPPREAMNTYLRSLMNKEVEGG